MATVAVIGTCDTKFEELRFLRDQVQESGSVQAILIDVGWRATERNEIAISQATLLSKYGDGRDVTLLSRGQFIEFISTCAAKAVKDLHDSQSIDGIVSAGGSGGTSLVSSIMRDVLPIGFPKLIVSTIASGDTEPIVGETDITLMYSVVDVAGLNHVLKGILSNAGAAIGAAATSYAKRRAAASTAQHGPAASVGKKRVGITMFGVTTPGVDAIRAHLQDNYPVETFVFHATGRGGRAMERLVREGTLDAVIDLTTTEIADLIAGGVMPAGADRLDAAVQRGIPNIVSFGATDMINFGARDTVPAALSDRTIVEHNPLVTLVRTSPEECAKIGGFIADKLKKTRSPEKTQVWITKGGVSMLAVPGQPFADAAADAALFGAVRNGLKGSGIEIVEDSRDVNNKEIAKEIAVSLMRKLGYE